jgi:GWxTD domain-containing protein
VFSQKQFLRFVLVILSVFFACGLAVSQSQPAKQTKQLKQTPDEKSRKVKTERNDAYARWLSEDVAPIVTQAERKAYEKLKTNEEREEFIKIFWRLRDPDPDTEENEYRDEHYERTTYANEHFASGVPGRLTDRGRIYIKFGKPDEIEAHPSGGSYQQASYDGGGSITAYPFETWFYRYIPGVGSGVEIEFVDPSGSGEYRIARDASEKNAMAHVSGLGRPADNTLGTNYRREGSPYARDRLVNLEKAPESESRIGGIIGGPKVDDNPLNFDVRVDVFKLSDTRVITAFTLQTANKELVFTDSGGLQTARLNIVGRIVTVTDQRVGAFEDSVTTSATIAELGEAKERTSAYSKVVALAPGRYRLDVVVRDVVSGATGIRKVGFLVPKYGDDQLATSSIILAAKLENVEEVAAGPFMIGQTKVIPNISGLYHRGQPVGVYLELYNAGIDQTTLRPSVDVEYVLQKDGKQFYKQVEDWRGIGDSGKRLTLARMIDTRELAAGEYELTIRIHDRVSGQELAPAAKFTLVK